MALVRLIRAGNAFAKIPLTARNRIIYWTRRFAREIQRGIQADMRQPKTGYWGKKPDGRTPHRHSAPGEAPAIWSGALYNDLNPRYSMGGMRAEIAPRVKSKRGYFYPGALETGTPKLAPRPYLQKGFMRYRDLYKAKIKQILAEDALRK